MRSSFPSKLCLLLALTGACGTDQTGADDPLARRDDAVSEDGSDVQSSEDVATEAIPPGSSPTRSGKPAPGDEWAEADEVATTSPSYDPDEAVSSPPSGPTPDCSHVKDERDGVCDDMTKCRFFDPDCRDRAKPATPVRPDKPVVCASADFRLADGVCDRTDPCFKKDEDCVGPITCLPFGEDDSEVEASDRKCEKRDLSHPCTRPDPDCNIQPGGPSCPPLFATNGRCEADKLCATSDPVDCGVTACLAIRYPDDGKCDAPPGCRFSDPNDCAPRTVCPAIGYATNGKCEAPAGCESNDPIDCGRATH